MEFEKKVPEGNKVVVVKENDVLGCKQTSPMKLLTALNVNHIEPKNECMCS